MFSSKSTLMRSLGNDVTPGGVGLWFRVVTDFTYRVINAKASGANAPPASLASPSRAHARMRSMSRSVRRLRTAVRTPARDRVSVAVLVLLALVSRGVAATRGHALHGVARLVHHHRAGARNDVAGRS